MNHQHHDEGRAGTAGGRHARPLAWSLALTGGFLLVEVAAGFWTGSLALLADAAHMLTDAAALALALFAIWFAIKPPTPTKTYGYYAWRFWPPSTDDSSRPPRCWGGP